MLTMLDRIVPPRQYFSNMVDGVKPRSEPLMLRRVIMNSIPQFGKPPRGGREEDEEEVPEGLLGCCPYLQLFKGQKLWSLALRLGKVEEESAFPGKQRSTSTYSLSWLHAVSRRWTTGGKLIFTSPSNRNGSTGGPVKPGPDGVTMLPWAFPTDGSIIFSVDCVVQGDILIRSRHLSVSGQKVSMFRAAFHTGYVPCGVLRLSKSQLDGACSDSRFDQVGVSSEGSCSTSTPTPPSCLEGTKFVK